jgi:hypothetical protein
MTYLYSLDILINFSSIYVCVDLNYIPGDIWRIIKKILCEFKPENYF